LPAQKDQVAGRFNGHLFDKVLMVLEEAFLASDPAAVAAAKALVTNPERLGLAHLRPAAALANASFARNLAKSDLLR
jgi:hypothetical protein